MIGQLAGNPGGLAVSVVWARAGARHGYLARRDELRNPTAQGRALGGQLTCMHHGDRSGSLNMRLGIGEG